MRILTAFLFAASLFGQTFSVVRFDKPGSPSGDFWGANTWGSIQWDRNSGCFYNMASRGDIAGVRYNSNSIYGGSLYCYQANPTFTTRGSFSYLGGVGYPNASPNFAVNADCAADKPNVFGDRHPLQNQSRDTRRNVIWWWGGPAGMGACTQNGTLSGSTITNGSGFFASDGGPLLAGQNGTWVGEPLVISSGGTPCATVVLNAITSTTMTLASSTACPDGAVTVTPQDTGDSSPRADLYKQGLPSTPAYSFTRVFPSPATGISSNPPTAYPDQRNNGAGAYDPDDDVTFQVGYASTESQILSVLCLTDKNPTPGTLTARQIAVGCTNPDGWNYVTATGYTGTCGANVSPCDSMLISQPGGPGLGYDPVTKKVWMYVSRSTPNVQELWSWKPTTKQWAGPLCTSGACASNMPPRSAFNADPFYTNWTYWELKHQFVHVTWDGSANKAYLFNPAAMIDNTSTPWTEMTYSGQATDCTYSANGACQPIWAINEKLGRMLGKANDEKVYEAQLPMPSLTVDLEVKEALVSGLSAGVDRDHPSACMGVPIKDADALPGNSTSTYGLGGMVNHADFQVEAIWPSGNAKWVKVCFQVPFFNANSTQTLTFHNGGSGAF